MSALDQEYQKQLKEEKKLANYTRKEEESEIRKLESDMIKAIEATGDYQVAADVQDYQNMNYDQNPGATLGEPLSTLQENSGP